MSLSRLLAAVFALGVSLPAAASDNPLGTRAACGPAATHRDAQSLESLAGALYAVVSGPAGKPKDWARLERLFAPGGIVTVTRHGAQGFEASVQTPRQFAELNDRIFGQRAFYETEIRRQIVRYGHIAHIYSSYEARDEPHLAPRARGVNSFQAMHDGSGWCILSLTWDGETPQHPIPAALDHAP